MSPYCECGVALAGKGYKCTFVDLRFAPGSAYVPKDCRVRGETAGDPSESFAFAGWNGQKPVDEWMETLLSFDRDVLSAVHRHAAPSITYRAAVPTSCTHNSALTIVTMWLELTVSLFFLKNERLF